MLTSDHIGPTYRAVLPRELVLTDALIPLDSVDTSSVVLTWIAPARANVCKHITSTASVCTHWEY